jgi:hypothetical protein
VVQGIGPEFKPQFHKKTTTVKDTKDSEAIKKGRKYGPQI